MTVTTLPFPRTAADGQAAAGRWRPSRAGILNVWRYHDEVLEFHNGRLLLRGPNGTGKSKALELLLPYLLDANLRPWRLSTFGGSERTMHWNLIGHGWEGTTRVGYVWIEFHRVGDDGQDVWITCGARLSATANTRTAKAAYFTTPLRVGVAGGLSLVNDDGRPLTVGDLTAAVGAAPQGSAGVYESGGEYRRAVRQALFRGLTEEQYDALITTLLQLRIPKLSEHLNPDELSRILSQALPPLDQQDVAEIAEGFEKLDRRREALAQLAAEIEQSRTLAARQRTYARRVLRAAAAALIAATTRMDNATRGAREQREHLQQAVGREERLQAEDHDLGVRIHQDTARVAGLRDTDAYKQGEQLAVLRREAGQAAERARRARADATARSGEADDDEHKAADAAQAAAQLEAAAGRAGAETGTAAARVGLESALAQAHSGDSADGMRQLLRAAVAAREGQIGTVRAALRAHADAVRDRDRAERRRERSAREVERAETERARRADERDAALTRLGEALAAWAEGCRVLPLAGRAGELVALAEDEPALIALVTAAAGPVSDDLARQDSTLDARRAALTGERDRLAAELAALEANRLLVPDPPATRTTERGSLPGGPLWKLVSWADGVSGRDQARIEAALQTAGLLDAWVLPSGGVRVDGHDTFAEAALTTTPAAGVSLDGVLTVEPGSPVPADRVRALLAGIAVGPTAPDHPAAVGADGSWRLGPAHGSWAKDEAWFIGAAARERNRQRRMAELRAAVDTADTELERLADALAEVAARREVLAAETRRRPAHRDLEQAGRHLADAERDLAARSDDLEDAEWEVRDGEEQVARALRSLTETAAGAGLPAGAEALDLLADALRSFRTLADTWVDLLVKAEGTRLRAADGTATAARSRRQAADAADHARRLDTDAAGYQAKLELVEQSVGAEYRDILDRIRELEQQLTDQTGRRERITEERITLSQQTGQLRGHLAAAEEASESATAERDEAAARLQRLRGSGMVADASLSADLGDLDGTRATLTAARQLAEELSSAPYEPRLIQEAGARLSETVHAVQQTLAGRADLSLEPDADGWLVLAATVDGRRLGAAALHTSLVAEHERAAAELTDEERDLFDEILTGGARRQVADRIRLADQLVRDMNDQLGRVATASRLRVRLRWQTDPEQPEIRAARDLLLRDPASLPESDRAALHRFFRDRIESVREASAATGWEQQLLTMLDYTAWHEFVVQTDKSDGNGWTEVTRRRHAALSGGEKAIVLHLPLFAAAAAHYRSAVQAPRMILLDEVFVGVDSNNRGQLLRLLTDFDLDMVLTSDHEWCTYPELDGIAIHQIVTGTDSIGTDGDDAVTTARFVWDGAGLAAREPVGATSLEPDRAGHTGGLDQSLFDVDA